MGALGGLFAGLLLPQPVNARIPRTSNANAIGLRFNPGLLGPISQSRAVRRARTKILTYYSDLIEAQVNAKVPG
jgi:hypothetical protein